MVRIRAFATVLLLILLSTSCDIEKRVERKLKRAEKKIEKLTIKYPQLLKTDTHIVEIVVPEYRDTGAIRFTAVLDTIALDSLKALVLERAAADLPIEHLLYNLVDVGAALDVPAVGVTNDTFDLSIWIADGVIHYALRIKEQQHSKEVTTESIQITKESSLEYVINKLRRWFWWIVVFAVIISVVYIVLKHTPIGKAIRVALKII